MDCFSDKMLFIRDLAFSSHRVIIPFKITHKNAVQEIKNKIHSYEIHS